MDPTGTRSPTRTRTAIQVWEIVSGHLLERIPEPDTHRVALCAAGAMRAVAKDGTFVEWDAPRDDPQRRLLALSRRAAP
jgi:hypothetical protein